MAKPIYKSADSETSLYRMLPSLNLLLLDPKFQIMLRAQSRTSIVRATRIVLNTLKSEIEAGLHSTSSLSICLESIANAVQEELEKKTVYSLRPVINATGVILHTNLGRAPLSQSAIDNIAEVAKGYCNLE